jgi:hypothetical protein
LGALDRLIGVLPLAAALVLVSLLFFYFGLRWIYRFSGILGNRPDRAVDNAGLVIHQAIYGRDDRTIDVTDAVRRNVRDGRVEIVVGNELGGDPCHGVGKLLTVQYSYGGREHSRTLPEAQILKIP